MNWGSCFWWLIFILSAVALQPLLPGLDFLLPLFIVALQEDNPLQLLWVSPILILIQEGTGTMGFGATLLWYSAAVVLFFLGRWLFEVENFMFIFLLSACLGASHYLIFNLINTLQTVPVDSQRLFDESVFQALLTPLIWRFAYFTRKWVHPREATN